MPTGRFALILDAQLIGFCIFLGDVLVSWKTKKQSIISRSIEEAEYRSLAAIICELQWFSYLLTDFSVPLILPIDLFCDNKEPFTSSPIHSAQFADLFIKVFPLKTFSFFLSKLGLVSLAPSPTCWGAAGVSSTDVSMDAGVTANALEDDAGTGEEVDMLDQG
ncbi:UNVERIFIED_CONTAM: hypothetical protein Sradi_0830900 [Sesamum radiatum]|uniref:Uncharacterized protein n=1 Tax=Sesamum radiatum TaxID=300843 RepID=A0AAW2VR18_SESRA